MLRQKISIIMSVINNQKGLKMKVKQKHTSEQSDILLKLLIWVPFIFFPHLVRFYRGCNISDITWMQQQYTTPPEPLWRRGATQTIVWSSTVSRHQVRRHRADRNRREPEDCELFNWSVIHLRDARKKKEKRKNCQDLCEMKFGADVGGHSAGVVSSFEWNEKRWAHAYFVSHTDS